MSVIPNMKIGETPVTMTNLGLLVGEVVSFVDYNVQKIVSAVWSQFEAPLKTLGEDKVSALSLAVKVLSGAYNAYTAPLSFGLGASLGVVSCVFEARIPLTKESKDFLSGDSRNAQLGIALLNYFDGAGRIIDMSSGFVSGFLAGREAYTQYNNRKSV